MIKQAFISFLVLGLSAQLFVGCRGIAQEGEKQDQDPGPGFAVPRMPSIALDGDGADWGDGGFRVEALITEQGKMPGQGAMPARDECSAAMRLGWNDSGLLVLLDVIGRDWREADQVEHLYGGDSIEFYLARRPGGADRCQWLVAPGMDARFPEPRAHLQAFGTTPELYKNGPVAKVGRKRTESGYMLESLLPWSALKWSPKLGEQVAFQVMVSDHGGQRPSAHLLFFPILGASHDGRKLHRLRLAEKPDLPLSARASVHADHRKSTIACEVIAPATAEGQEVRLRSAKGVLAVGKLGTPVGGYARAMLSGPRTDDPVVFLDLNGKQSDAVPLTLPRPEMAIETSVRWEEKTSGLAVVLGLPEAPPPGYRVARRKAGEAWQELAKEARPGAFRDENVSAGTLYEYAIGRGGDSPATDYFWAGHAIPPREYRGVVLLLVEASQAKPLAAEIRRLMFDLVGDGWQVRRHDVEATRTPAEIRKWIHDEYDRAPAEVNTVFILGHLSVAYAGNERPDGHGFGACPADVYYGALKGDWVDKKVNAGNRKSKDKDKGDGDKTGESGDGQFDQDTIPGPVELAVGRVDFARMPAFGVDETTLLRRYLDRDHAYRQARLAVADRALVHDNFLGHAERFSYSGWQNFTTLLDPEKVKDAIWPNVKPGMNLLFYACGPGHPEHMQGFGSTADLVKTPTGGVFTMLFGSIFGEWIIPNNLMRAALGHENGALACGWAGRPHWYLHSMGMGETIGECLRRTQNNDGGDYQPTGSFARGVHIALMGDPTLRLHRVVPPSALKVDVTDKGARLSWTVSPQKGATYHVYRAVSEFGPYERLTEQPLATPSAADPKGTDEHHYQVRAVVLQQSTTGTYCNTSQGLFANPPVEKSSNP